VICVCFLAFAVGSPDDARDDNSYKGSVRVFQFDEITLAHAAPPTSSPSASPSSSPAQESAISGTRTEDSNSPDTVIDTGMDPGGEKAGLVELEDYLVAIGDFFTNLSEQLLVCNYPWQIKYRTQWETLALR